MKAVKKSNLHQTNVNVKGHIAKTKSGTATYVDPHQRKDMVADKPTDKNGSQGSNVSNEHLTKLGIDINNTTIKSTFNDHLTNGEIIAMADIGDKPGERGLTENMKRLAIKGSDGTVKDGFFKSLFNDPFIYSNAFLRSNNNGEGGHITLNDNDNNPLSKDEHKIIEKKLTDNNVSFDEKKKILDSHKGQMAHRELATLALGKMLKMDHLPDGSIREIDSRKSNGEPTKDMGFVSGSVFDKFKEAGADIKKGALVGSSLYDNLTATDKKFGDKIVFDYLIGNTDRHGNNFFVKTKGAGYDKKYEMLAFDHGLTFGASNNEVLNNGYYGFNGFSGAQKKLKAASQYTTLTKEFVNNLNDIVNDVHDNNGGQFKEFTNYLEQKIGKREADAFTDRFADVVEGVLGDNDKNAGSIIRTATRRYMKTAG